MDADRRRRQAPELQPKLAEVYRIYSGTPPAACWVEFYPYAGINNCIRLSRRGLVLRVSDLLEDAPEDVLLGLFHTLVARLFRRRAPRCWSEVYRQWVRRPDVREMARRVRRLRGRKRLLPPQGESHDLQRIYDRLNHEYFGGELQVKALGWSLQGSRRQLGHWDPAHQAIVLDRRLDLPAVPEYVVAYVLFHEMLHAHLGEEENGGLFLVHHPRFRAAERRYPDYRRARQFIRRHFG